MDHCGQSTNARIQRLGTLAIIQLTRSDRRLGSQKLVALLFEEILGGLISRWSFWEVPAAVVVEPLAQALPLSARLSISGPAKVRALAFPSIPPSHQTTKFPPT